MQYVSASDLVVVGWHPCEENECAPVVAKVRQNERPHWSFAEDLLPGNAPN